MAKKKEELSNAKTLLITVSEEGLPTFRFTGVWSPALLERMAFKAQKALRQHKVRIAQEGTKALMEKESEEKTDKEE